MINWRFSLSSRIGHRDHRGHRFARAFGWSPMLPIPPMTDAVDGISACPFERISRRAPFADRLLAVKHKPGCSSTGKLTEIGRNELAPAALRVHQVPYGLGKIGGFDGVVRMVVPPN